MKLHSYPGAHQHQTYVGKEDLNELERVHPLRGDGIWVRTDIKVSILDDERV